MVLDSQLEVPDSVATGASTDVKMFDSFVVYITGITTATVQVEISADDSNWFAAGAAVTADGIVAVTSPCKFVRCDTTAYTSGTIVGTIVGVR